MASKRLRAVNKNEGESAEMDMSPMIDMVFLLLLFFLVVSNPKTIKIDSELEPPVADASVAAKTIHGKIVMNVRKDDTFWDESGKLTFPDSDEMKDYLEKERKVVESKGYTPVLHVRAHKDIHFTFVRQVIRAGADAGIEQVAYGSYNK